MNDMATTEIRRATVLCVETDPRMRERLEAMLPHCDCSFAGNAYEALRAVQAFAFDAYILDYWMPDWSGPLLCREIRKYDPHSPVIVCTEAQNESHSRSAMRAGANAYLLKPIEADGLAQKLRELLRFADSESVRATSHAERVLRHELARHGVSEPTSEGTHRALSRLGGTAHSIARTARARTHKTFIDSGGTRARFERWWTDDCEVLFSPAAA